MNFSLISFSTFSGCRLFEARDERPLLLAAGVRPEQRPLTSADRLQVHGGQRLARNVVRLSQNVPRFVIHFI